MILNHYRPSEETQHAVPHRFVWSNAFAPFVQSELDAIDVHGIVYAASNGSIAVIPDVDDTGARALVNRLGLSGLRAVIITNTPGGN